ncbi:MAG: DMT family transporter [Candidatus Micrarchaeota archaeon]|nr:DMT family transporter [Candidatus Micrarchaeota archaeon]MDE1804244.1 DMT family transporter [Candidatus Micrarchaeota archaeon]MDE1846984.1 DMT family transporter [Candidatus Micrarchaeota archaeon]
MPSIGIVAALVGLLMFSVGDTISKRVSERLGHLISATVIVGAGIISLAASLLFLPSVPLTPIMLAASAAAGVFTALGFLLVLKSLETEQVSNTMGLLNLQYAVIIILGIFFLSENVSALQYAGLIIVFAGSLLVTLGRKLKVNRMLLPAVAGNLCWGVGIAIISYSIASFAAPTTMFFLYARLVGFSLLLAYLLLMLYRRPKRVLPDKIRHPGRQLGLAVLSGMLAGGALFMITMFTIYRMVTVGGAILALEPVLVAIYGAFLYRDRMSKIQLFGIAIAVIGGIVLSI